MSPRERSVLEKVIFEEWTVEGKPEKLEIKRDDRQQRKNLKHFKTVEGNPTEEHHHLNDQTLIMDHNN